MNESLKKKILDLAHQFHPQIIDWRRQIHQNPEPSFEERQTAAFVASILDASGIAVRTSVGGTGVLGMLTVSNARRTLALRADMDALRIREATGLPFASKRPDVGHLCGHDSHVAMLLGAAQILARLQRELPNSVRFLFQPAEEIPPGGAGQMIKDGALDGVDEIFGLHVDPQLPTGAIGLRSGPSMAATDTIEIRVIGKGAHAATPHMSADSILAASQVILALQSIVSRRRDPLEPAVLSICKVNAGTQYNIIPSEAVLLGTVRTLNESLRQQMPRLIEETAAGAAAAHGCTVECRYTMGHAVLCNHPESVEKARRVVQELMGPSTQIRDLPARMGGEDFALYLQKVPGAFIRLGVTRPGVKDPAPLHSPKFDLDEDALWVGAAVYAALACVE